MKLEGIEAARGVAALMVVTVHATSILGGPKDFGAPAFGGFFVFGRAGVDFFFVLSGFIIAFVHNRDLSRPSAVAHYWYRRLWRIYPIYWVATAIYMALLFVSPTADGAERNGLRILASLTLIPDGAAPILSVGWSLRHELLFYALFGVCIVSRGLGAILLALWAIGICSNAVVTLWAGSPLFGGIWDDLVFRVFNIQFFFGMAVAMAIRRGVTAAAVPTLCVGSGMFLVNGVMESWGPSVPTEWPIRHLIYAVASALMIYALAAGDLLKRWRVPRVAVELGAASYSIYLIHVPVLLVTGYAFRKTSHIASLSLEVAFVMSVCMAAVAGWVLSRLVEQPLLRLARSSRGSERLAGSDAVTDEKRLTRAGARREA